MDPRDPNEALEREPYHTRSVDEITEKLQGMTVFTIADFKTRSAEESRYRMEHIGHFPTSMEMCMDDRLTLTTEKTQQKQFQGKAYEQCCSTHSILPDSQENTVLRHAEFPLSMESMPLFPGKQFLQGKEKSTLGTKLKPSMDTYTSTSPNVFYKKERYQDTTPGTVNMVTTHILMSVHSQDSFSKKLD